MSRTRALLAALLASATTLLAEESNEDLEVWLEENEPLVIRYLEALGPSDVGRTVEGVTLTDGTIELAGFRFLGRKAGLQQGQHAWKFCSRAAETRSEWEIWYFWVEPSSKGMPWPECAGRWHEPGGAYSISGDISIEGAIHPGMLVYTICDRATAEDACQPPNGTQSPSATSSARVGIVGQSLAGVAATAENGPRFGAELPGQRNASQRDSFVHPASDRHRPAQ